MKLIDYIKPRGTQMRLSREIGVPPVSLHNWATGKRPVPAERCPEIEKATLGAVTCEELNADVDWSYLRGTDCKGENPQCAHLQQGERVQESIGQNNEAGGSV
jgi:DNA-binding transcriptional regulator YdaS (Cro superfamily)